MPILQEKSIKTIQQFVKTSDLTEELVHATVKHTSIYLLVHKQTDLGTQLQN